MEGCVLWLTERGVHPQCTLLGHAPRGFWDSRHRRTQSLGCPFRWSHNSEWPAAGSLLMLAVEVCLQGTGPDFSKDACHLGGNKVQQLLCHDQSLELGGSSIFRVLGKRGTAPLVLCVQQGAAGAQQRLCTVPAAQSTPWLPASQSLLRSHSPRPSAEGVTRTHAWWLELLLSTLLFSAPSAKGLASENYISDRP